MKSSSIVLVLPLLIVSLSVQAQWTPVGTEGFSPGVADELSLEIAPDGSPNLAYRDGAAAGSSSVCQWNGSAWIYVGGGGGASFGASLWQDLAIADDGTMYIVQRDGGFFSQASVYKNTGGSWSGLGGGITASPVDYTSIAIAPDGNPYIAYKDFSVTGAASVKRYDGAAWVDVGTPGFSAGIVEFTEIAFNPVTNEPYVAFRDFIASSGTTVMRFDGAAWVNVGTPGISAGTHTSQSLAFDSAGNPYVAFMDGGSSNGISCMTFDGAAWVNVGPAGFSTGIADFVDLAIKSDGTPYVSYKDFGGGGGTTVSMYNGTNWVNIGAASFSAALSEQTEIDFNNIDTLFVSYKDFGFTGSATVQSYGPFCISSSNAITETACMTYTVPSGSATYTTTGIYMDTLVNALGCDSLLTIDVTIDVVDTAVTADELELTSSASGAGVSYQWIDCSDSTIIVGETNQLFTSTASGSYAVIVDDNGCIDTSACYTTGVNHLGELMSDLVNLYPNPASDQLTVSTTIDGAKTITIYDQTGRLLKSFEMVKQTQIDISNMESGTYLIQVQNLQGELLSREKFIKL